MSIVERNEKCWSEYVEHQGIHQALDFLSKTLLSDPTTQEIKTCYCPPHPVPALRLMQAPCFLCIQSLISFPAHWHSNDKRLETKSKKRRNYEFVQRKETAVSYGALSSLNLSRATSFPGQGAFQWKKKVGLYALVIVQP